MKINIYVPKTDSLLDSVYKKSVSFVGIFSHIIRVLGINNNDIFYVYSRLSKSNGLSVSIGSCNNTLIEYMNIFDENLCVLVNNLVHKELTNTLRAKVFNCFVDVVKEQLNNVVIDSGYIKCDKCDNYFFCEKGSFSICKSCDKNNNQEDKYVYIIEAVNMGFYKIGWSSDVRKRITNLAKMPFDIRMIHKIKTNNPRCLELDLHNKYNDVRVNGEWFKLDNNMLSEILCM